MPAPIKAKGQRYYAIRVESHVRIEKAETPWLACEKAFGVVYDRPDQKAEYKDCGPLKGSVQSTLRKEGGWKSLVRTKITLPRDPAEVAPEIVKDQTAQPSKTVADVLHNAPMQEVVARVHPTPCRFIVGDNVRYRPGHEHDVGTVTEVAYSDKLGTYVITADLPRGSFRAPASRWDFALPSESNPDIAAAVSPKTHPALPTFPQKDTHHRVVKLMCWDDKGQYGYLYLKAEGRCGVYVIRRSGRDIYSLRKQVLTEELDGSKHPYFVRISRSIRSQEVSTTCTCPGFIGSGRCRHADALRKLVHDRRI